MVAVTVAEFSYCKERRSRVRIHENAWRLVECPHCGVQGKAQLPMQYHLLRCDLAAETSKARNPEMRESVRRHHREATIAE